ncbi:MAG TPA: sugar phosphate nucleotidyltransferase [Tabrizicola sp.]|nr:sugar phosphate nucleotidyltransferase [Tabrizicola sp.]
MGNSPELVDTVAIVLAGGQGTRLYELTARDCKPALPFARFHRIVDFTMASLARSGIDRVMVATQYQPAALSVHLRDVWSPVWPEAGLNLRDGANTDQGSYRGTADVLRARAADLDAMGAREVLVVAADHIYSMDYRGFIAAHRENGAPLTVAAMPVPREEAGGEGKIAAGYRTRFRQGQRHCS